MVCLEIKDASLLRDYPDLEEGETVLLSEKTLIEWATYIRDRFVCPTSSVGRGAGKSPMFTKDENAFIYAHRIGCTVYFHSCKATPHLYGEILRIESKHLKTTSNLIIDNPNSIIKELNAVGIRRLSLSNFIYIITMASFCYPDWSKEEFRPIYEAVCNELLINRYIDIDSEIIREVLNRLNEIVNIQSALNGTLPLISIMGNLSWFGILNNEINAILNFDYVNKKNIAKKSNNHRQRSINQAFSAFSVLSKQRTEKQEFLLEEGVDLIECRADMRKYLTQILQYPNVHIFSMFEYGTMINDIESVENLYKELYEFVKEYPQLDKRIALLLMIFPFYPPQYVGVVLNKPMKTEIARQYENHGANEFFDIISLKNNRQLISLFNAIREFSGRRPITRLEKR